MEVEGFYRTEKPGGMKIVLRFTVIKVKTTEHLLCGVYICVLCIYRLINTFARANKYTIICELREWEGLMVRMVRGKKKGYNLVYW